MASEVQPTTENCRCQPKTKPTISRNIKFNKIKNIVHLCKNLAIENKSMSDVLTVDRGYLWSNNT